MSVASRSEPAVNRVLIFILACILGAMSPSAFSLNTKDCGEDLLCLFDVNLEEDPRAIEFITKKVEKRLGTNLRTRARAQMTLQDGSRYTVAITFEIQQPIKIEGHDIPKGSSVNFVVYKNDVQLVSIDSADGNLIDWSPFEPTRQIFFCKWTPMYGALKQGVSKAGLKVLSGRAVVHLYSDGTIKAAQALKDSEFEFKSKRYSEGTGMVFFKKNGDAFSKADIEKLMAKSNVHGDRVDEIRITCLDDEVNFIPDDQYSPYLEERGIKPTNKSK